MPCYGRLASVTMTPVPGGPPPNRAEQPEPRGGVRRQLRSRYAAGYPCRSAWPTGLDLSRMFGTVKDTSCCPRSPRSLRDYRQQSRQ